VEKQHLSAIGAGALGKHQQRTATAKALGYPPGEQQSIPRTATDEQGARALRQPAGQRPLANLRLGQERQRRQLPEQGDIGPGDMIGDPEHRLLRQLTAELQTKRQRRGQPAHEALAQALPQGLQLTPRERLGKEYQTGQQHPAAKRHEESDQAQALAQSAHQTAALKCRA